MRTRGLGERWHHEEKHNVIIRPRCQTRGRYFPLALDGNLHGLRSVLNLKTLLCYSLKYEPWTIVKIYQMLNVDISTFHIEGGSENIPPVCGWV